MSRNNLTKIRNLAMVTVATIGLVACQSTDGPGTKETIGTLGGAAAGAVIGSQIGGGSGQVIAGILGALAGGYIGNQIGVSLDRADQAHMARAQQQAYTAPVGQSISWHNPDSGIRGTVTPTRQGTSETGQACREYTHKIMIGGKEETAVGVACQNPDGTWTPLQ